MKYNFDQLIDRKNTGSTKWDMNEQLFGTDDVLDMWVADMDFPCPEPVVKAIQERAKHPVFGYTFPPASLYEAIVDRMKRYYNWEIKKEWIVYTTGIVSGVHSAVKAVSMPGDQIILQPPVYYPFYSAIKDNGCHVVANNLKFDGERYEMDFDNLESLFKPSTSFPVTVPRIRGIILCHPHNPVGRVWTKDELTKLAEICGKNNCVVISDEIHCDLLMKGVKHYPTATLSKEIELNTITFMSASKTFNIAGLPASVGIIPDPVLRAKFTAARAGQSGINIFGLVAMEAAFRYGDEYVEQLQEYIDANMKYFIDYVEKNIPPLKVVDPEGTYLGWVDMRGLGLSDAELHEFMIKKAKLALDDGFIFGTGGSGFQRFNLACPRAVVQEALSRLEKAVKELKK
ncbi:MAG: MalY/PatB family protein [bacterium]|jgi:cystathionine beta-lyase